MDPEPAVKIADWLFDPVTRPVAVTCSFVFLIIGYLAGSVFSRHAFGFIKWYLERRDRRKQEEEHQQKKDQRDQAREKAMSGLFFNPQGILLDANGWPYCLNCVEFGEQSAAKVDDLGIVYCPYCSWKATVPFRHIRR